MRSNGVCLPQGARRDSIHSEFPLITVGITCFNAADTIARAIESAMKQDWPNKEIIRVESTNASSLLTFQNETSSLLILPTNKRQPPRHAAAPPN